MFKIISTLMTIGLVVVAFTLNQGCGSSTTQVPISTLHSATYVGSGSVWEWALSADGTFTAKKKATSATLAGAEDLVINGTYVAYSTGFYNFTVTSATSPNSSETPPAAATTAVGFAVPGVVLMVKAEGGNDDDILVMPVLSTACPSGTVEFNWVQAKPGGHSQPGDLNPNLIHQDMWGNASLPLSGGNITGTKYRLDTGVETGQTFTGVDACANGKYNFNPAGGFISMTSSGVGIVKNDSGSSNDIVAVPRETSVTLETVRNKEFVGLVFTQDSSANGSIRPVNISMGATNGTYALLSDVSTGATSETGTITLLEAGSGEMAGFIKLTASGGSTTATPTMWAAVNSNIASSGRTFFFASGGNLDNATGTVLNDPFALVVIQK